jgi:hypothetical protein
MTVGRKIMPHLPLLRMIHWIPDVDYFFPPLSYRGSIGSGHRPIGAELERMVITESLLMEMVSIVIQHPLNPLYPVVKDELQSRPLNFTQKFLNAKEKILWPGELLSCQ